MKTLTNDVVFQTAKDLITANGSTTTLDVKNELRNKGYWATQHTVSGILFADYAGNNLDFTQAGNHRQYVMATTAQVPTAASNTFDPTTAGTPPPSLTSNPRASQSIDDAIALCEANGLVLLKQAKGNLKFGDPANKNDEFYTITAKGYARRHYANDSNRYQLNKKVQTTTQSAWGPYTSYKRVLLPGQYVTLAETVVRIAKKHRS